MYGKERMRCKQEKRWEQGRGRLTLGMLVAQSTLAHVCELDRALGTGIHEPVAADRVKLSRRDDLGQFLHVGGLDVDDVEALVLYIEVPEVDAQVVTADKRLSVAVYRDAVDVIGVGVGVRPTGDSGNDGVVVCEAR